jgi:hypothetical protein
MASAEISPLLPRSSVSRKLVLLFWKSETTSFQLARSGRVAALTNIITSLKRDGYSASQIEGPLLKRQLADLIKATRANATSFDLRKQAAAGSFQGGHSLIHAVSISGIHGPSEAGIVLLPASEQKAAGAIRRPFPLICAAF